MEVVLRSPNPRAAAVAALALCALLAPPALAADGVLEISQTCATQTGCFAGDSAGFPVTINDAAPLKSFRLTSDLVVPSANVTAVSIQTSLARIDLGGFAVRGPVTCGGTPLVCAPPGVGDGIAVIAAGHQAVEVRGGVVSGMGHVGVAVGIAGVVENVRATQNGLRGISAASGGTVRASNASFNGSQGIVVAAGAHVVDSTAEGNGGDGINANAASVVLIGNTSRGNGAAGILGGSAVLVKSNTSGFNGSDGISVGSGSTISENSVAQNQAEGIRCTDRCNISGNSATFDGNAAADDEIECGAACSVRGNVASVVVGSGFALNLGATSIYRENLVETAGAGSVSGGVNRGDNFCTGAAAVLASCP